MRRMKTDLSKEKIDDMRRRMIEGKQQLLNKLLNQVDEITKACSMDLECNYEQTLQIIPPQILDMKLETLFSQYNGDLELAYDKILEKQQLLNIEKTRTNHHQVKAPNDKALRRIITLQSKNVSPMSSKSSFEPQTPTPKVSPFR